MALKNAAADVMAALSGLVVSGVELTDGVNLFNGGVRPNDETPAPCVFLLNTGGGAPSPYVSGSRRSMYFATVQVMVRGAVEDFEAGESLARGVLAELALLVPTGYVSIFARESAPTPIGYDDAGRPMWSLNFEVQYVASLP